MSQRSKTNKGAVTTNKENHNRPGSAVISTTELREIRALAENTRTKTSKQAAIVTKADLDRFNQEKIIVTRQEQQMQKTLLAEQKESQQLASRQRKERMQELDRVRASKMPKSQQERENSAAQNGLLSKAQAQLDEQEDDVKAMNAMMLYSKVVTIRDQQLNENKQLEKEWAEEQKRLDLMMEIERLKDLQVQESREKKRQVAAYQGSRKIVEQIQDREEQRQREQDILDKERQQLLKNIETMRKEDLAAQEAKAARARALMVEVEASNKRSIQLKQERHEEEKALEQKIIDYNKAKIAKEELAIAEAKRLAEEKEREIQRLRELQEKAADRQAEIDELRAKRASEEHERQARAKAQAEIEKQARIKVELEEARLKQFRDKESRLTQQARAEREDFMRVISKQREDEEQEKKLAQERTEALMRHKHTLQ